jgi:DNA-binding phage protein
MEITDILQKNRIPFTTLATRAGVSRNTIYNMRQNPDSAKIGTLRRVVEAMGYRLVVTIERPDNGL